MKRTRQKLSREELEELYLTGKTFAEMGRELGASNRSHSYVIFQRELKPTQKMRKKRKRKKKLKTKPPKIYVKKRCKQCNRMIFGRAKHAKYCKRHGTNKVRQKRFYWKNPERYRFYQRHYRRHKACWIKTKIWKFIVRLTKWFPIRFK